MEAMIFAAGLGTRLRPLTNNKPKALVEINGKTLLEIVITKLKKYGIKRIIINVHHFADDVIKFVKKNNYFDVEIVFSEEKEELLNTGGGLKKACNLFTSNTDILIYNVDILSDIDINKMLAYHIENKAIATLAVRERETSRYLLFDENNSLCAWENTKTNEKKIAKESTSELKRLAFSGIQIVSPKFLALITENGAFSIIDTYLRLAKNNLICGYNHSSTFWLDLGKVEAIKQAELITLEN